MKQCILKYIVNVILRLGHSFVVESKNEQI